MEKSQNATKEEIIFLKHIRNLTYSQKQELLKRLQAENRVLSYTLFSFLICKLSRYCWASG